MKEPLHPYTERYIELCVKLFHDLQRSGRFHEVMAELNREKFDSSRDS